MSPLRKTSAVPPYTPARTLPPFRPNRSPSMSIVSLRKPRLAGTMENPIPLGAPTAIWPPLCDIPGRLLAGANARAAARVLSVGSRLATG